MTRPAILSLAAVLCLASDVSATADKPPVAAESASPAIPESPEQALEAYIRVPFELSNQGYYVLSGKANGHEIHFAVDSGADSIIFHQALADSLGIELEKSGAKVLGAGGKSVPFARGKVAMIELPGGLAIQDQSFPFIDLNGFTEATIGGKPAKIGALLGMGFIESTGMILDCGRQQMLVPRKTTQPGAFVKALAGQGGSPVKLIRGRKGKLYLPIELDGEPAAMMIDTGAGASTLYPEYVRGRSWKIEQKDNTVTTLGQTREMETATVPMTSFGAFKVPNIPFVLVGVSERDPEGEVEGREVAGLIGLNLLRPLRAVLDFGGGQAVFPVRELTKKRRNH